MYGIVTFHDGINFGAFLQVYAMQGVLKRMGVESVIINYKNRSHWMAEYSCHLRTKRPSLLINNILKILKFKKDQRQLQQTKFSFTSDIFEELALDGVFFGADEIWNCSNPLFSLDKFYFGESFQHLKRISYAASCGALSDKMGIDPAAAQLLKGFDSISVRDDNSRRLVEKATGISPEVVLDPTLIYDFDGSEQLPELENFILVYSFGLPFAVQEAIRAFAAKQGKKLVSIGYLNTFCDVNIISIGPFDFLGYIKKADFVVTSMFHGVMFSLKYGKQFALLVDPYRTNKLETTLKYFNLHSRIVSNNRSIPDIEAEPLNYQLIDQRMKMAQNASTDFIKRAIKSENL